MARCGCNGQLADQFEALKMSKTIHEIIEQLHHSLQDYIEATYHLGDPALIAQRRALLQRPGVIHQVPYLESTPRYETGSTFGEIDGLAPASLRAFRALASASDGMPQVLHDPAYLHQSDAVRLALVDKKNLIVMTGTGSGKTESFLLPILGKLAKEAQEDPERFGKTAAMRALILYPMNALVNDQLGRLRSIFGDKRIVKLFTEWAGRPPRFARYTSRTPYAGVRTAKKDPRKLKSFEDFYVEIERSADGSPSEERDQAAQLRRELHARGKWPAKPSLAAWYGAKGSHWLAKDGTPLRAICLPEDSELLTRHEVQASPPDLLVTNYSMLEYMLMRPIERAIFDRTSEWLKECPRESFLVILDEAHLYRGAPGAEVGLLLRRLRSRLGIGIDRFQVICATASFSDKDYAPSFGAQLSGAAPSSFVPVTGTLRMSPFDSPGTLNDAHVLAAVDLDAFYSEEGTLRRDAVRGLLEYRGIVPSPKVERDLFEALREFPPLGRLINITMKEARALGELGAAVFPSVSHDLANAALSVLMALGSVAREDAYAAGLLPCRVHNFYRGLPGLWVCMDPACTELESEDHRNQSSGRMFAQPRERCGCGAQVLELFTCRNCGTAYGRAYADSVESPNALWSQPGMRLRMPDEDVTSLVPLDLLLEAPRKLDVVELVDYDLETGRLNPPLHGTRMRQLFIRKNRLAPPTSEDGEQDTRLEARGQFVPCGVCGTTAAFSRSSVQDHQTKGDQPFQTLVSRQLQVQPPSAVKSTVFAPLRGRKVLAFSDSRQVAARLAPNLQMYSTRDSLRPMLVWGFRKLQSVGAISRRSNLDDSYLAVLLAAKKLGVRLRPELASGETLDALTAVETAIDQKGALHDDTALHDLWIDVRNENPPVALLDDIYKTILDKYLGLEALALASIAEREEKTPKLFALESIPGVAEAPEDKAALARAWLRCWQRNGLWLGAMPAAWWLRARSNGTSVRGQKSKFTAMERVLPSKEARKVFDTKWLPVLLNEFTSDAGGGLRRLEGKHLTLRLDGEWVRCQSCKSVHRPVATLRHCFDCGSKEIFNLDPLTDAVFSARKGYYRHPVLEALGNPPVAPMAIIAAEHTAQLNAPTNEDVFSKAEENELLFQDVEITWGPSGGRSAAIDVLSSTTTMEVGIDIGALSGVALRNMPPGRANYQQRAGRAGRRGNAVATVVAFGSADSHDEHYFSHPERMVRGAVVDPRLTLDNAEIANRNVRAFLLQAYHRDRIPGLDKTSPHDLFSVLGTVSDFRSKGAQLNRSDFESWLIKNEPGLREQVREWLPLELSPAQSGKLLANMVPDCLSAIDHAVDLDDASPDRTEERAEDDDDAEDIEVPSEEGEERPAQVRNTDKLLDRLLYCGVLPRYAFPTDVAAFSVFDRGRSTGFRHVMRFAPSQSLPIALSQYAPGKDVWISGKCYTSGAIYSPIAKERSQAFKNRRIYRECTLCGFAHTLPIEAGVPVRSTTDCIACGGEGTFGPARYWMRPPGFAHPVDVQEVTSPDDMPETSYATRAKLTMQTPADDAAWLHVNDRVRVLTARQHLLVSNTGPEAEGYTYCSRCGRIESSVDPSPSLFGPHSKPYPDDDSACDGTFASKHLVLGTDFITDVALFSMRIRSPLGLRPGTYPTNVALRTASEALAKAACQMLDIEAGEIMAEHRPALTKDSAGREGLEAEIFLYDTLSGGAGFSALAAQSAQELFRTALRILKDCPEGCDSSCYRCLRSFKNKVEHRLLDRHVGAELLEHLVSGLSPQFDSGRMQASARLLFSDLQRQADLGESFQEGVNVPLGGQGELPVPIFAKSATGQELAVLLAAPLANDNSTNPELALALRGRGLEVVVINELLIRGNLPAATRVVQNRLRA